MVTMRRRKWANPHRIIIKIENNENENKEPCPLVVVEYYVSRRSRI